MKRGTGCLESPADPRDHPIVGTDTALLGVGEAPPDRSMEMIEFVDYVNDQGPTESCVLQAIQSQHYVAMRRLGVATPPRMSRLWGYWHARRLGSIAQVDKGCTPRLAWKALAKCGFCREVFWPFDTNKVNTPPSFDATARAVDQTWVQGYYRVWGLTGTSYEVRQAIAAGHPVVFGTPVDHRFMDYEHPVASPAQVLQYPSGPIAGRHMMLAVAYDPESLWVLNSWGNWGHEAPGSLIPHGFFRMAWDWVDNPAASDWWAVRLAQPFAS